MEDHEMLARRNRRGEKTRFAKSHTAPPLIPADDEFKRHRHRNDARVQVHLHR